MKCRECGSKVKLIPDVGPLGVSVEAQCTNPDCMEFYEVESDYLDQCDFDALAGK